MTDHHAEALKHLQALNDDPPDDGTETYDLLLDMRSALIALTHAVLANNDVLHVVETAVGQAADQITEAIK